MFEFHATPNSFGAVAKDTFREFVLYNADAARLSRVVNASVPGRGRQSCSRAAPTTSGGVHA